MPGNFAVLDAVVVGAGQAGLGVSYYLARAGVGPSRPRAPPDRRVLANPALGRLPDEQRQAQTVMPGQRYDGPDPEGFMSQHGWVALLEAFVEVNRLPVKTGSAVTGVACAEGVAGAYRVEAPRGVVLARNVVIASGARNRRAACCSCTRLTTETPPVEPALVQPYEGVASPVAARQPPDEAGGKVNCPARLEQVLGDLAAGLAGSHDQHSPLRQRDRMLSNRSSPKRSLPPSAPARRPSNTATRSRRTSATHRSASATGRRR